MTTAARDPLLTAARIILTLLMALAAFIAALMVLAVPAIIVTRERVLAEFVSESGATASPGLIPAIVAVLLLLAVITGLSFVGLRLLRRVVDSVSEGDPFVPVNADRLRAIAWLALSGQLLTIPLGLTAAWIASHSDKAKADFGVSLDGLLLALVLFVLARVFRKGAEMREELEGTV